MGKLNYNLMKAFALGLLATAATAGANFKLKDYAKSKQETILDSRIAIDVGFSTEWYWGLRSPVQWGKKEDYHEAITWSEELYTKAYFDTYAFVGLYESNGTGWFGLTISPWIPFWDM